MNRRESTAILRSQGFKPVRPVRHGILWSNGTVMVLEPRKFETDRNAQNFLAQLKRALTLGRYRPSGEPC